MSASLESDSDQRQTHKTVVLNIPLYLMRKQGYAKNCIIYGAITFNRDAKIGTNQQKNRSSFMLTRIPLNHTSVQEIG